MDKRDTDGMSKGLAQMMFGFSWEMEKGKQKTFLQAMRLGNTLPTGVLGTRWNLKRGRRCRAWIRGDWT